METQSWGNSEELSVSKEGDLEGLRTEGVGGGRQKGQTRPVMWLHLVVVSPTSKER